MSKFVNKNYKDGLKYRIEAEVKNTFFTDSGSYPFDTVSFLGRKKKYSNKLTFLAKLEVV